MTTRLLPRSEWRRLAGTEAETVWPHLPHTAQVLVVEDGEQIAGCWVLMPVWHVECLYVAPEHRGKASVARRLLVGMKRLVRDVGARGVMTAATSDAVRALLAHVGAEKVPGDHYVMSFGG